MRDLGCLLGGLVVLAAVAAIGAPRLLFRGTCCSNDTAAIATLRNLASCQEQFRASLHADLDGDGFGEYGTFGEMTGTVGVRADPAGAARGTVVNPPILSAALAAIDENGIVTKSGYAFRIFLPGPGGTAIHEGRATAEFPFSGPLEVDRAEASWCAYAWPVAVGNSGTRVFFVDPGGDVWQTSNANRRYSGMLATPGWEDAMPQGGRGWAPAPDTEQFRGRDGNLWKRTN